MATHILSLLFVWITALFMLNMGLVVKVISMQADLIKIISKIGGDGDA